MEFILTASTVPHPIRQAQPGLAAMCEETAPMFKATPEPALTARIGTTIPPKAIPTLTPVQQEHEPGITRLEHQAMAQGTSFKPAHAVANTITTAGETRPMSQRDNKPLTFI